MNVLKEGWVFGIVYHENLTPVAKTCAENGDGLFLMRFLRIKKITLHKCFHNQMKLRLYNIFRLQRLPKY